jgi:hypothetical protein
VSARFEIAGGTVIGRDHARAGRNGQDAWAWGERDGVLAAVVTDGCSSAPHSEVGAKIGARVVLEAILAGAGDVTEVALARLRDVAEALGGVDATRVHDYLLFTTVALVVREDVTTIVAAGDGVVAVNGARVRLGPFPDNAPPYLAYALLGEAPACRLEPVVEIATAELASALIGSDGALDVELSELWRDDAFFRNPDQVRRRLTLLARDPGLADDTTVAVVRRRP